jgi:hypothetical protein
MNCRFVCVIALILVNYFYIVWRVLLFGWHELHPRSAAGDILWRHVILCSCDIRHASADCWVPVCKQQILEEWVFWRPTNIAIYIESKIRALVSQILKACSQSSGIAPHTLNFSVQFRWILRLTLMPFYSQWYRIGGQLARELGRTFWRREKYVVPGEDRLPDLSSIMKIE